MTTLYQYMANLKIINLICHMNIWLSSNTTYTTVFVSASETKIVSHSPLLQSEENLEAGKTAGNLPQSLTQKLTVKYIVNLTEDFKGMQC
jgi:hypothetical protein